MTLTKAVGGPLAMDELRLIDAYWRAANYLSVGQIYLCDNPLLREPLTLEHVKPRLLGHWGTTPGTQPALRPHEPCDRPARPERDLRDRSRPWRPRARRQHLSRGHLLRGLSARRPRTRRGCAGCFGSSPSPAGSRRMWRRRRRDRSTRAGSSAMRLCTPTAPCSTTRTCSRCASSATARPRRAPLAASWHSNKFLNPARDGAVLPVLHLNGYKIANPTVLARIPRRRAARASRGLRALAAVRGGRRARGRSPGTRHGARLVARRDRGDTGAGATRASVAAPPLADDRAAHAEGLDRPEGGRRPAGRGHVPLAPGSAREAVRESGAPAAARGVAALLPPGRAVRRDRPAARGAARPAPRAASAEWAPTRTRTAASCCAISSCPTSATTRLRWSARPRPPARRRGCWAPGCAT